ncbi:MAG: hypothetical protein NTW86_21430 [Candidatus Sumerlaeota bacterium]|nr:hypothetical protein [Candidatus Sumerlaeota bacterium]
MNARVKRLRDEIFTWKDTVCPHRPRIVTEAYRKYESDPVVVKRAKALRDVLEQMPIYIREGNLIVGAPTSTPGAWIVYPEFSLGTEKIVQVRHNIHVGNDFIRDHLPEDLKDYWATRNCYARYAAYRRECFGDRNPPSDSWYMISTALGHLTVDFRETLERGLTGVSERARRRLEEVRQDDPEGAAFLRAVIIAAEGGIAFANRYAQLAEETAARVSDPRRKQELQRMAEGLRRIYVHGARSYHDALQSVWLSNQIMHIEGNAWSMSPGRVDQICCPYFQRDVARGELTREQALELAECFLIKFKENSIFGMRGAPTQCITLGGRAADGRDQTNELTYLFLEAAREVKLAEPLIHVRWHKGIPKKLMHACFDCLEAGLGMPMFLNDEATPEGFMNLGIEREAAFDYTHVGCGELGITGKLQDSALGGSTGHIAVLVQVLRRKRSNGKSLDQAFPTFEDLLAAVRKQMRANAEHSASVNRAVGHIHRQFGQIPFTSAFMHGCIERARDLTVRCQYNFPSMNLGGGGFPNFVNSLAAIRQAVYRDHALTLGRVVEAIEADFQGFEDVRAVLAREPKFGNDDDRVDDLLPVVEQMHAEAIAGLKGPRNDGRYIATGTVATGHIDQGRQLIATPDGRHAGRPMAAGMNAAPDTDRNGLTALLNSVQKLNSTGHWFGGYILNFNILPDVLASEKSREKLMMALESYFMRKGLNLQMNCVSADMLRDAQHHPEDYRSLMVRISGYNDYFTMLDPGIQEEIIGRTAHGVK